MHRMQIGDDAIGESLLERDDPDSIVISTLHQKTIRVLAVLGAVLVCRRLLEKLRVRSTEKHGNPFALSSSSFLRGIESARSISVACAFVPRIYICKRSATGCRVSEGKSALVPSFLPPPSESSYHARHRLGDLITTIARGKRAIGIRLPPQVPQLRIWNSLRSRERRRACERVAPRGKPPLS